MAPLEFQHVCSVNAPKDFLHPCAWSYKISILNKRNYITLSHKYSFLLAFFLSPPSNAHLWKDPHLDFRVISIESQRNLPFPALNQGSQSIWWIIPRASKMRNKGKTLLPGATPTMGRLFLPSSAQGEDLSSWIHCNFLMCREVRVWPKLWPEVHPSLHSHFPFISAPTLKPPSLSQVSQAPQGADPCPRRACQEKMKLPC